MPNAPVQLVLNNDQLRGDRKRGRPGDNGTDFFAGDNKGFAAHRDALTAATAAIRESLAQSEFNGFGHVRVTMSRDAIAKTHRPQTKLFRERWTPQVGTEGIGEPIFAVTPAALDKVIAAMEAAETDVAKKTDIETGKSTSAPTRNRCEVSAIASVSLWTEADRREFSAVEAVSWLQRAGVGSGYIVTCFPVASADDIPSVVAGASEAFSALEAAVHRDGLVVQSLTRDRRLGGMLALNVASGQTALELRAPTRLSVPETHEAILRELGTNPLVRSIALPPIVSAERGSSAMLNERAPGHFFELGEEEPQAKVGVIDGGVGPHLNDWVGARWGQLKGDDRDTDHGTFISGLLIAEKRMNPAFPGEQRHGCVIYDIDVLPADPGGTGQAFSGYYPGGFTEFFDEIEHAVEEYRREHGVRVFNLSINVLAPRTSQTYGWTAERLDEIAVKHDVIFVISAGNLGPGDTRPEWHTTPETTLAALTADTVGFLAEPGESLRNVSVSAVNPPKMAGQVPLALARYSRRGPGLRGATKPDFAHIGGSGTPLADGHQGILSVNGDGMMVTGAGTSYAAPLVARRLADLEALIDGNVSREVLLALMVHFANTPTLYSHTTLRPAAQNLIGFGMPVTAERMLQRDDSEITLVVSSVIRPKEDNWFEFRWPDALVDEGKCRGHARVTLVARPPIAYQHGDERVRANIDAHLKQRGTNGKFGTRLKRVNALPKPDKVQKTERDLLAESMKWQLVKSFETAKMTGSGPSADWRFQVDYLERADENLPSEGIPYAAVLTIADPTGQAPVFTQMRQNLNAANVQTGDLRTSIRARATA
ncbi:S8 family peptidase [Microbacterium sp. NPDC097977]|uniref:S8 family peptidase n=1 Tax=Microbacterium sp. NPDC097977 TaxID=3155686 RepID=UPI0033325BEC